VNKIGRNYELRVQATGGGPDIIIKPPFTVEFDIQRHRYSSATLSTIRIYNLSETNRKKLRKNQIDYGQRKTLTFRAGYGEQLSTVLTGNVMQGQSVREGNNFITTLQVFDGGFAYANAITSQQYSENTPYKNICTDLVKSLKDYDVSLGSIGTIEGNSGRGLSVSGSTIQNLTELTNGGFFIDNGVAHCLQKNECVPSPLKLITSETGLLNTPTREMTYLDLDILFEPKILAGQKVEVKSTTNKETNGVYQVISIRHRGIISESVNGDCSTSLTLVYGIADLKEILRSS
jgi:hypothetical protein